MTIRVGERNMCVLCTVAERDALAKKVAEMNAKLEKLSPIDEVPIYQTIIKSCFFGEPPADRFACIKAVVENLTPKTLPIGECVRMKLYAEVFDAIYPIPCNIPQLMKIFKLDNLDFSKYVRIGVGIHIRFVPLEHQMVKFLALEPDPNLFIGSKMQRDAYKTKSSEVVEIFFDVFDEALRIDQRGEIAKKLDNAFSALKSLD